MSRPNLVKIIVNSSLITACLAGVLLFQFAKLNSTTDSINPSQAALERAVEAEKTRLNLLKQSTTLGFSNLVADWAFLGFVQYFGDSPAREKTGYSLNPDFFEVIVNSDPRFVRAYLALSPATSIYAGRPDRTVALMNQGLKSISANTSPDSYYVWLYKGVDELLFLGDTEAAQHSYEMAAQWANTYSDPASKQVVTSARRTARYLASNPDSKQARLSAWILILSNAMDNRVRQLAIRQIQALGGRVLITPQGQVSIQGPKED